MSNDVHLFSSMEHRGVFIDINYLMFLKSNDSPINKILKVIACRASWGNYASKPSPVADLGFPFTRRRAKTKLGQNRRFQ